MMSHYQQIGWVQENEDILYTYIQHTNCQNECMYVGKESMYMETNDRRIHRHSNPKPYVP